MLEMVLRMTFVCLIFFFSDHLWVLFPDVVMVLASEIAVDVVKHAFITKFNDISADVSSLLITAGAVCSKGPISFSQICLIRDLPVIQQKQPYTREFTLVLTLNCQTNAHKSHTLSDRVCKFSLFYHCCDENSNSVRPVSACVTREKS